MVTPSRRSPSLSESPIARASSRSATLRSPELSAPLASPLLLGPCSESLRDREVGSAAFELCQWCRAMDRHSRLHPAEEAALAEHMRRHRLSQHPVEVAGREQVMRRHGLSQHPAEVAGREEVMRLHGLSQHPAEVAGREEELRRSRLSQHPAVLAGRAAGGGGPALDVMGRGRGRSVAGTGQACPRCVWELNPGRRGRGRPPKHSCGR